jgi:hypothetical protein
MRQIFRLVPRTRANRKGAPLVADMVDGLDINWHYYWNEFIGDLPTEQFPELQIRMASSNYYKVLNNIGNLPTYPRKQKMTNFHSVYCHSVRRAQNRLDRLKACKARPRAIRRQEDRLEARKAFAEARREKRAQLISALQSMVQELVDQHFPPEQV